MTQQTRRRLPGIAAWSLLFLVSACQSDADRQDAVVGANPERPAASALDRATAERRKARITGLQYELFVDLASGPEVFSGDVIMRFELADNSSGLTVDFADGSVASVTVNDAAVAADYNGHFITIPARALDPGPTEIRITYSHPYSHDGNGLHRFVDPEDGQVYLYTYLWPYYANRLMPSFDQPNLKASFSLRVRAPENWTVVSAAPGTASGVEGAAVLWTFATTPKIATYMFSLHAGPYQVWQGAAGDVPLRLLARRSIAEFVPVDEWFEITRRGMAFYERYFDIPYPFAKYDQVLAPEATIGGMENVAAVTFGEQYVQRQQSDRHQRQKRADVVLHELAHMWFGDLVTHDWWNGMWLNESFAELMAAKSLAEVTEFTDIWHGFLVDEKKRAFVRDSRVTTHPIEMPIRSTDEFHTVWDAITYEKGASVQKQLQHFVGDEHYRQGVSAYLKANRWGNTSLSDFMRHQEQSAGRRLDDWAAEWLLTPGFNTLSAQVECDGNELQTLSIAQTAPEQQPVLRSHSVDVALYGYDDHGALVVTDRVPTIISGAKTEVDVLAGRPCPVLVNPNYNDWTYAQLALRDGDVAVLRERLGDITDPLSRSIFLAALYDRALAGGMPLADYVDLALRLAGGEQNLRVIDQAMTSIVEVIGLMQRLRPETDTALERLLPAIEATSLAGASSTAARDIGFMWLNAFLGVVATDAGLDHIEALLDGEQMIDGIDLSPEIRWRMLMILSRHGVPGIDARLLAERAGDPSDFGAKQLLSARAAAPDPAAKAEWLAELRNPESLAGLASQRAVMDALFPASQTGLQFARLEDILASLPELSRQRDSYFLSSYTQMMLTPMCRQASAASMKAALDAFGDRLDATSLRFLREAHQADSECASLRPRQL